MHAANELLRPSVPVVLDQHVEEAAHLRHVRSVQVRAPHVRLMNLERLDERIAAHLDGIAVAGEAGAVRCRQALASPSSGTLFVATVGALEARDMARLDALLDVGQALPETVPGLLSAFGWVTPGCLRGVTAALLDSPQAWRREAGLAACELQGVDPQEAVRPALAAAAPVLRRRALRVAGRLGRRDLLQACVDALDDGECAFEAARAALLLGDRRAALPALEAHAAGGGPFAPSALALVLLALPGERAREHLARLAQDAGGARTVVRGIGLVGDPHFVPWLVARMDDPALARAAGESFALLTGLDLAYLDLERPVPPEVPAGPTDDPQDGDVAMDEDESLPWPDPGRIAAWWQANALRFPAGGRFFMGAQPSPAHCMTVLRQGFQRQRQVAAVHLCLAKPGAPLFNTAAPAWRQKRWLDAMA